VVTVLPRNVSWNSSGATRFCGALCNVGSNAWYGWQSSSDVAGQSLWCSSLASWHNNCMLETMETASCELWLSFQLESPWVLQYRDVQIHLYFNLNSNLTKLLIFYPLSKSIKKPWRPYTRPQLSTSNPEHYPHQHTETCLTRSCSKRAHRSPLS
jgi:hypothetical protein